MKQKVWQARKKPERNMIMLERVYENVINSDAIAGINPMTNLPVMDNESNFDEIEVIDLDDTRGQIKPTTWHQ